MAKRCRVFALAGLLMARIRSVKPDYWTDPDLVGLPVVTRLFFIGTWNHADDYGVLKDDPGRLKLQILPNDNVDTAVLIDQLVESGHLLRRVADDGTPLLVIRTFLEHQKIDKRAVGKWGKPDDLAEAPPVPRLPDLPPPIPPDPAESQPWKGREGRGTEKVQTVVPSERTTALAVVLPEVAPSAPSDVVQVFDAWKEATNRTERTVLSPERTRLIRKQLKQYPLEDVIDAVRGWRWSAHHCGSNQNGTVYNDLELLLRDAKHVEMFRDLERDPPERPVPRGEQGIHAWLDRKRNAG